LSFSTIISAARGAHGTNKASAVDGDAIRAMATAWENMQRAPHFPTGNLAFDRRRGLVDSYAAKELADSFRTVHRDTRVIAQDLPQEKYAFRAAPDPCSVGELLAHIVLAHNVQYTFHATERDRGTTLVGFDFPSILKRLAAEEKESLSKEQILEMLHSSGKKRAGWRQGLADDFLAGQVQLASGMTPPSKSRFEMILSVKEHEMHPWGQLMLFERLLGIVPHRTRETHSRLPAAAAKI
jgi:hypothetical protein